MTSVSAVNNTQNKSFVKPVAIGAGIGAGVWGVNNLLVQKQVLANKDFYSSVLKDSAELMKDQSFPKFVKMQFNNAFNKIKTILDKGKISKGMLGKQALIGAAIVGGAVALYKLCTSKKAK